jgi:hypothetical protein
LELELSSELIRYELKLSIYAIVSYERISRLQSQGRDEMAASALHGAVRCDAVRRRLGGEIERCLGLVLFWG